MSVKEDIIDGLWKREVLFLPRQRLTWTSAWSRLGIASAPSSLPLFPSAQAQR